MTSYDRWRFISPSKTLLNLVGNLANSNNSISLDLACGLGRNSIVLAAHGFDVISADRDLARLYRLNVEKETLLEKCPTEIKAGKITTVCADLSSGSWPFSENCFDNIVIVHYLV